MKVGTETDILAARRELLMPAFITAAFKAGIPVSWALAIARKETSFVAKAVSPLGAGDDRLGRAWGAMQVTSATAKDLGFMPELSLAERGKRILDDPAAGISLGCALLAKYQKRLGTIEFDDVAAAYNCGPGRVLDKRIPASTRNRYVPAARAFRLEYLQFDSVAETDAIG